MDAASSKKTKMMLAGVIDSDNPSQETELSPAASLDTLPEELIDMIFLLLKNPKDLISLSNATPKFSRILEPEKTTFMFEKVFPLIFPKLEKQDILNCRFVCKQWNGFVDDFLQNSLATRNLEPFPYRQQQYSEISSPSRNPPPHCLKVHPLLLNKHLHPINFSNPATLANFLTEMDNHPRNPFALRFISLMSHQVHWNNLLEYWHQIRTHLLPKFGKELYHLQICPTGSQIGGHYHDEMNFYYRNLQNVLKQSPNLKSLMLYGPGASLPNLNFVQTTHISFGYRATNPLPPLPKLETLSEAMWNPVTQGPVMDEVMKKYSKQLKTISLGLSIWKSYIPQYTNLPRCSSLYIHLDDNLEKWEDLCRQLNAPNLGKLSLSIQGNHGIGMSQIFKPLQQPKFQSLVYLRLNFMEKLLEKEPTQPYVLENVKTLEVLENRFVPYDQLLRHLPRLEYMLVCYDPPATREEEEKQKEVYLEEGDENDRIYEIRKWMFSGNMYKSYIWRKMEFLKEFIFGRMGTAGNTEFELVSTVQYTREIYNRFSAQPRKGVSGKGHKEN